MYHQPVLLNESIEGLDIRPDGIYADLTYGSGGHSREILKRLEKGKLMAFDQDEDALKNAIDDERFLLINGNYRFFTNFLRYHGINEVDGIIADLGVSSHQFDEAERGFSFRFDSRLDMRMNQKSKLTAAEILNTYTVEELCKIFRSYGEVINAYKLAQLITGKRVLSKIETTEQFKVMIGECIPRQGENKYLAQVFQALRMEVNDEIESLKEMLIQSASILKKEGSLVVITYHSLEDRLVKNFIRSSNFEGILDKDLYGNVKTAFRQVNRKVIVPDENEIENNNRSRSAKLRIAKRI